MNIVFDGKGTRQDNVVSINDIPVKEIYKMQYFNYILNYKKYHRDQTDPDYKIFRRNPGERYKFTPSCDVMYLKNFITIPEEIINFLKRLEDLRKEISSQYNRVSYLSDFCHSRNRKKFNFERATREDERMFEVSKEIKSDLEKESSKLCAEFEDLCFKILIPLIDQYLTINKESINKIKESYGILNKIPENYYSDSGGFTFCHDFDDC